MEAAARIEQARRHEGDPAMLYGKVELLAGDGQATTKRKVRGIAYSGGVIPNYGWCGDMAIDLSTLQVDKDQIFILLNHEYGQPVGTATLSVVNNQLIFEGELFNSTEHGKLVASTMAEGAQWKASVGVNAKRRYYDEKTEIVLNGQTMEVDTVLEQGRILELSFVPSGADPGAFAAKMHSRFSNEQTQEELMSATPPAKPAAPAAPATTAAAPAQDNAAVTELQTQMTQLLAANQALLLDNRKTKLTVAGVALSAEQEAVLGKMDQPSFDLMLATLSASKPNGKAAPKDDKTVGADGKPKLQSLPANLTGHQATDDDVDEDGNKKLPTEETTAGARKHLFAALRVVVPNMPKEAA